MGNIKEDIKKINPEQVVKEEGKNKSKEYFRELALTDALTGAWNRNGWELLVKGLEGEDLMYGICDIDFFKKWNDEFGHAIGDQVLKKLAEYLDKQLIIGRFGGEEFVFVVPYNKNNPEKVEAYLNQVREGVKKIKVPNADKQISISIGYTEFEPKEDMDKIFEKADCALYEAKENGRDRVEKYNKNMKCGQHKKNDKKELIKNDKCEECEKDKIEGKIYKNMSDYRQIAYWITDTGDILDATQSSGHSEYICDNLQKLIKKYPMLQELKDRIIKDTGEWYEEGDTPQDAIEDIGWDEWYKEIGYEWIVDSDDNRDFVYALLRGFGWIAFEITMGGDMMSIDVAQSNFLNNKSLDDLVLKYVNKVNEIWVYSKDIGEKQLDKDDVINKGIYKASQIK